MLRYVCQCGWATNSSYAVRTRCHQCGVTITLGKPDSRGLGDTIHSITTALHIPHCGGCEERRDWLNKIVPYRQS